MLTIFTGAPKGTNAVVSALCAKHNHQCFSKISPCSTWAKKIMPLHPTELEKASKDVHAVALQTCKVLSSLILINNVKTHWHIVHDALLVLVLGYRDHMVKTTDPRVQCGLCEWTVELAKFMNKPLYFYDSIYEEWLWWSYIDREFVQVGGMREFDVASPSLQNNVAIVGTSDMTSEAQIELTRLFESYK